MDVAAWLQGLGLERYVPGFRDNEIDWNALPKLSGEDLKDLGVVLGSHRRRLLDAIAALGAAVPAASATAAPRDASAPVEAERRPLCVMFCDLNRLDSTLDRDLIPRICGRSSAPTSRASPPRSSSLTASSRVTWVTGC